MCLRQRGHYDRIHVTLFRRLCGLVVRVSAYKSRGSGFDYRHYQIFWEMVGLERSRLDLVSTTEELLGRNSSSSGLERLKYGRRDPLRWPRDTLYPQKLALTSLTSGGSLGRYSSLTDWGHGVCCFVCNNNNNNNNNNSTLCSIKCSLHRKNIFCLSESPFICKLYRYIQQMV
jgi:hypothetical protein